MTRKQRKAEPDPVPALLESLIASIDALRAVLLEQLTARTAAEAEGWIAQRDSPIPRRTFTRLCRELCERGDPRAAVRARVHYLQQAAIDEWLRGAPGAHRTPRELARQNNATKLQQVERDLDLIFAEAVRPLTPAEQLETDSRLEREREKRRAYRRRIKAREAQRETGLSPVENAKRAVALIFANAGEPAPSRRGRRRRQ